MFRKEHLRHQPQGDGSLSIPRKSGRLTSAVSASASAEFGKEFCFWKVRQNADHENAIPIQSLNCRPLALILTRYWGLSDGVCAAGGAWSDFRVSTETTFKLPLPSRTWMVFVCCVPEAPYRTIYVVFARTCRPSFGLPGLGNSTCCSVVSPPEFFFWTVVTRWFRCRRPSPANTGASV